VYKITYKSEFLGYGRISISGDDIAYDVVYKLLPMKGVKLTDDQMIDIVLNYPHVLNCTITNGYGKTHGAVTGEVLESHQGISNFELRVFKASKYG
jgi:hypothetical protein